MEFSVGTHVVIELMDERKIAGFLVGGSLDEGGWYVKATHRDSEVVRSVSEVAAAGIREQLEDNATWRLRVACVLTGNWTHVVSGRELMLDVLFDEVVEDLLSSAEDGIQLRELKTPVMTFVASGAVMTIEDTADRVIESEVNLFDQTPGKSEDLDRVLAEILGIKSLKDEDEDEDEG